MSPINIVKHIPDYLRWALGMVLVLSVVAAIATEEYLLLAAPLVLLLVYQTVVDFRSIFWLLLLVLPLSTEFDISTSLATDLPTEPLMVGLFLVTILYFVAHPQRIDVRLLKHPIGVLLLVHLFWIIVTTIFSNEGIISLKYLLAKLWYMAVFVVMATKFLRTTEDFKRLFWLVFFPLLLTNAYVFLKMAQINFAFADIQEAMKPFYRNHVTYAALLTLFFPLTCIALGWFKRWSWGWWLILGSLIFLLMGIQLSYTRAAYVSLLIALGSWGIIKLRLMKWSLALAGLVAIGGLVYLTQGNKYLDYAPNYDTTISHKDFNNLVEATYKLEDISTMERVYRWVAAFNMVEEEPVFGFGPGNFYQFYKGYTVNMFKTYVSDNPERSGVHSYFLMIMTEQGVIGLLIFLALTVVVFVQAERIYHETHDKLRRQIVLGVTLSLIVIYAFLLINDMIETDKVGSFFFLHLSVLMTFDLHNRRIQASQADSPTPNT